jgi:hypothetical protein
MRPGRGTSTHYFSCSRGPGVVSTNDAPRLVTPNMCLYIWWDLWVMYCGLVRLGHETSAQYFTCSRGPDADTIKNDPDTLLRTCVFTSHSIYGSSSAFGCIRGTKRRRTNFHARVGLLQIQKKCARSHYAKHVFLLPVRSTSDVVHSGPSRA